MKTSEKRNKIAIISGIFLLLTGILVWLKIKATPNKVGFYNKLFGNTDTQGTKLSIARKYDWYKVKTAYEFRGFSLDVGYGESFAVNDFVYGYISGDVLKTTTRHLETSIPLTHVEIVNAADVDSLILKPLASLLERINKSDIVVGAINTKIKLNSISGALEKMGTYDEFTSEIFMKAIVEINKTIDLALTFARNSKGEYVVVLAKTGRVRSEDLLKFINPNRSSGLPYSNFDKIFTTTGMGSYINRKSYDKVTLTYDPDFVKNDGSVNGQKVEIYFNEPFSGTSASKNGSPVASVINGVFLKDKIYQGKVFAYLGISLGIDITEDDGTTFYLPFSNGVFTLTERTDIAI